MTSPVWRPFTHFQFAEKTHSFKMLHENQTKWLMSVFIRLRSGGCGFKANWSHTTSSVLKTTASATQMNQRSQKECQIRLPLSNSLSAPQSYSSNPLKCTVKTKTISSPYPHSSNTFFSLLLELSFNLYLLGAPSSNSSPGSVQRWNLGWGWNLSANSVQQGSYLPGLGKEEWRRERKRGNN